MASPLTVEQQGLSKEVAALVHDHQFRKAAQLVSDACRLDLRIGSDKPRDYLPPLQTYLHWLLNNGGRLEAANLLWTPSRFNGEPKYTQDVWNLFDTCNTGLLMGGASCSKSYSMGVCFFLEWIRDPENTTIRLIGPKEDHLEANLFSHLVGLHDNASLPMPGEIGSLFIGLNRRNLVSSIKGLVIPVGNKKKAGTLQGTKRLPRSKEHPIFGDLTRLFVFVDEAELVPGGVWSDIDNLLSNLEQVDSVGLKIFMAYNPTNQFSEVGIRAEPVTGWGSFNIEKDYRWKSKRGWDVLRLDGERSENVVAGKIIYPGLQSRPGLERIATNSGGRNSSGYLTMGRGAYPIQGLEMTIIPAGLPARCRGEAIWMDTPKPLGGVDMALEGGATAIFTVGKMGMATGIRRPPSLEHPNGHTEMFKDKMGRVIPRWVAQADQQITLPKGDTIVMKTSTVDLAKRAGIRPEHLCLDRTGNGAGTHDLVKHEWSGAVIGVNYSSAPTDFRIMSEDAEIASKTYDRIDSELWFALNSWMEFGVLLLNPAMELSKLTPQLTQRLYRVVGGKKKVESKKDYKDRGNESPDEADSLTLFIHAARVGEQVVPSMRGDVTANPDGDEDWADSYYEHGSRIDPSNRVDTLEE